MGGEDSDRRWTTNYSPRGEITVLHTPLQNKVMDKIEKKEKKKRKEQEHREQSAFAKYLSSCSV